MRISAAAGAVAGLLFPMACVAQQAPLPQPTPRAYSPYVSAEEEVTPNYDSESGSSTVLNLRGQLPYTGGATQYLLRLRIPIVTSAPQSAITGAGDLSLFDLVQQNGPHGRWLYGATLRVPTAQNDSLGSGKYSVGPAIGYETYEGPWTVGFFNQSFFSVIGPASRAPVGQTKIEPSVSRALGGGWGIGTSSMSFTYDWVRNAWTEVPVGLRIDKSFSSLRQKFDAYFEGEKNLAAIKGAPAWTLRAGLRWTLPR
jgi:hypothetical protein